MSPRLPITVAWPGASAEDVETNILDVLEPELRFLDDIEEVTSYRTRRRCDHLACEFSRQTDLQKAQSDVEQAVARITTLPEDAERPIVSRATFFDDVANIAISGPFSETGPEDLRQAAARRPPRLPASTASTLRGRARRGNLDPRRATSDLRRLGLTLEEISRRVRENTQDLPAGKPRRRERHAAARARRSARRPRRSATIEIKSVPTGEKVLLKDIAEIDTRFDRDGKIGLVKGERAIELIVQRVDRGRHAEDDGGDGSLHRQGRGRRCRRR